MKLRNILFGFMTASFAFSACSKDDAGHTPLSAADAKIAISVLAGGVSTKADAGTATDDLQELAGEASINNITALVFDESGTVRLGYKWQPTTGTDGTAEITDIEAKAVRVLIALIANTPDGALAQVRNYGELQTRLVELSSQSQSNLTMSSALIRTNEELARDGNYIGYSGALNVDKINTPVVLTRLVARVDLVKIETSFAGTHLGGRTVTIDAIYMADAKTASHYFSPADWGVVEASGSFSDLPATTINAPISDAASLTNPYRSYVMENSGSESPTRIVLKATIQPTPAYAAETKYFSADINRDGLANGYNHNNIKRNYVYYLNITFGRNSFENKPLGEPTDPTPPIIRDRELSVQVRVANWGLVTQSPEID